MNVIGGVHYLPQFVTGVGQLKPEGASDSFGFELYLVGGSVHIHGGDRRHAEQMRADLVAAIDAYQEQQARRENGPTVFEQAMVAATQLR